MGIWQQWYTSLLIEVIVSKTAEEDGKYEGYIIVVQTPWVPNIG